MSITYNTTYVFDNSLRLLQKVNIDGTDLKILSLLARNGRLSYRNIGLAIGMTPKSVKSRVDRMLAAKVIEKFLALVNPSVIGYSETWAFALRKNELNRELVDGISLVGDTQYRFEVMGGLIGFEVIVKKGAEENVKLLLNSLKPTLFGLIQTRIKEVSRKLTRSDYAIMKQLVRNPRAEVRDIAVAAAISSKTVRRRLDALISDRVIEFSIQPNPDTMRGYIVFFLDVRMENKSYQQKVLEKIYEELDGQLMLSSCTSNPEGALGLLLGCEDAVGIESIRNKIESFEGVQQVSAFLPIRLSCPQEWVIRALDRKLAEFTRKETRSSQTTAQVDLG